ncbi:hypothetical protein [Pseudoduganella lutea]|uniref:Uncharacterized protein n=1 Tax=Pseudoduganella lutea TaxID=321985 RepID=A0A4P6KT18_9BURK|nr:hypothetical protein [Pseudoduganella lutea]QBE61867.1 hypothetical protein EWM63_01695 [Pseudoduganella lutea]
MTISKAKPLPAPPGTTRRHFLGVAGKATMAGALPAGLAAPMAARAAAGPAHDVRRLVGRGDIIERAYRPEAAVGRYQGNGRFGGVYAKLGLHAHPDQRDDYDRHGFTQIMHMKHWGRFFFHSAERKADTSADYLLPLARIHWQDLPEGVTDYLQHQSFMDGTVVTRFRTAAGSRAGVTTWFDPVARNLSAIELDMDGPAMPLVLAAVTRFVPYAYGFAEPTTQSFRVVRMGDQWRIDITCAASKPAAVSALYLKTDAAVEAHPDGLLIRPRRGRSQLFISYGEPVPADAPRLSLRRTRAHWQRTWETSAMLDLPDERAQQTWVRSLAYILSTFNDDGYGFTPTNGFSGNLYMFNYAQDLFYVHPTLLASGNVAPAKAWIERFAAMIPGMRDYARRLWPETRGIYPPWELPFGPVEGYHDPSVPIVYCYEPHNAGYLCRMAHDTALMVDDPAWTRAHALPLIEETARFFHSFCRKEPDGRWHLFLSPSVGQDEAGGRNQKDYLCALYSARYSFQKAIEHGLDTDGRYRRILQDGLAFDTLLSDKQFYYASAGSGPKDYGTQKHPVQLNGLAYLPTESKPQRPNWPPTASATARPSAQPSPTSMAGHWGIPAGRHPRGRSCGLAPRLGQRAPFRLHRPGMGADLRNQRAPGLGVLCDHQRPVRPEPGGEPGQRLLGRAAHRCLQPVRRAGVLRQRAQPAGRDRQRHAARRRRPGHPACLEGLPPAVQWHPGDAGERSGAPDGDRRAAGRAHLIAERFPPRHARQFDIAGPQGDIQCIVAIFSVVPPPWRPACPPAR